MKKIIAVLMCAVLCMGFVGCKNDKADEKPTEPVQSVVPQNGTMKIYIGRGNDFDEHEKEYTGELTAAVILENMQELTDWNLACAEEAETVDGKVKIDFAAESSVYTGAIEDAENATENDEVSAESKNEFVRLMLDSVAKTIEKNMDVDGVEFKCNGEDIVLDGKNASEGVYEIGKYEQYGEEDAEEFLKDRLSGYYDTPITKYEKYGEEFKYNKRLYIYQAIDKDTNELLGTYKVSSDLRYLYEATENEDKLIWSIDLYKGLTD